MTRDPFSRRLRAYRRGEHVALVIGALPLLAIYVAVHTRWLKPLLQDHKHLMVALMIVLPLAWLLLAIRGWKRFGSHWLGLRCAHCGHGLAESGLPPSTAPVRCPACGVEADFGAPTPR